MPISVIYHAVERDVFRELVGKEHVFHIRVPDVFHGLGLYETDGYALRRSFEKIQSPEDAFGFLKFCGGFRRVRDDPSKRDDPPKEDVLTWSEFVRWKALVQRLHLREPWEDFPLLGSRDPESKDDFLSYLKHESAEMGELIWEEAAEQLWSVSDETFYWLQGLPSGWSVQRDRYLSYEETKKIFSAPGADVPGSRAWYDAQAILERRRAKRAKGNAEGKQRLIAHVVAASALDAILATIYIDKLRGIRTEVCDLTDCEQIFEIKSKHGQKYCCNYHAHLASVRRNRPKPRAKKRKRLERKERSK